MISCTSLDSSVVLMSHSDVERSVLLQDVPVSGEHETIPIPFTAADILHWKTNAISPIFVVDDVPRALTLLRISDFLRDLETLEAVAKRVAEALLPLSPPSSDPARTQLDCSKYSGGRVAAKALCGMPEHIAALVLRARGDAGKLLACLPSQAHPLVLAAFTKAGDSNDDTNARPSSALSVAVRTASVLRALASALNSTRRSRAPRPDPDLHLQLEDAKLAHKLPSSVIPSVRKLTICYTGLMSQKAICRSLHACTALTGLELHSGELFLEWLAVASNLTALCRFNLQLHPALTPLRQLKRLHVQGCNIQQSKLPNAAALTRATLSKLTHLHISNSTMDPEATAVITDVLTGLPHLRHLELSRTRLQGDGMAAVGSKLTALTLLSSLKLASNCLKAGGAVSLAAVLPSLSSLRSLDVAGNLLCDEGAHSLLPALSHLSTLQSLDLSYNCLFAHAMTTLPRSLTTLTHLSLSGNTLSVHGVFALAPALLTCNALQALNLGYTLVNSPGYSRSALEVLSGVLTALTRLTALCLAGNLLSEASINALIPALVPLERLQSVDVSDKYTKVPDAHLLCLQHSFRGRQCRVFCDHEARCCLCQ